MNLSNNNESTDFCHLCDRFHEQYQSIAWLNVIYISLLVCIFIFACTLLYSAPAFCWAILLIFILLWFFTGRTSHTGLVLLAIFLVILLFTPSNEEMDSGSQQIFIKSS